MACNHLIPIVPISLSTMKKLRHMDLSYTNFTGDLSSSFGSLSNLSRLIEGNKFYQLGDSPPTTQANADENFVLNKVRKHKTNPMGRGGIAFMVGVGTLLAIAFSVFMAIYLNNLVRLRSFKSNHNALVSHHVTAAEEASSTALNENLEIRPSNATLHSAAYKSLLGSLQLRNPLGVAQVLNHLHYTISSAVVHYNLKVVNILLDKILKPLCDIGLAILKPLMSNKVKFQTSKIAIRDTGYTSPDHGQQGFSSMKSGIFAFWVLLMEFLTGRKTFDGPVRLYRKTRSILTRTIMQKQSRCRRHKRYKEPKAKTTTSRKPTKKALLIAMMHSNSNDDTVKMDYCLEEITNLKEILMQNFEFFEENIKYTHPTKKSIRKQVLLLVTKAHPGDILFLYIAGHCWFCNDTPAIMGSDDRGRTDAFWSFNMMRKVPLGVRLTVMINTCFSGSFLKGAREGGQGKRGEVVVYPVCGEDEIILDGQIYFEILEGFLRETTKKTHLKFYRRFKKAMQLLNLIWRQNPPIYCPPSEKRLQLLEFYP